MIPLTARAAGWLLAVYCYRFSRPPSSLLCEGKAREPLREQ